MDSFTATTKYGDTIEVKRNKKGKIVVLNSDYGTTELVPLSAGDHKWVLFDLKKTDIVIIDSEEERLIDEGIAALGGAGS